MTVEYDDIIVGAGSSGAVLAARLSEDPARRVLLLEAGPDYASLAETPADLIDYRYVSIVEHDWKYRATARDGRTIIYPRGKVTGGCSAVNSAQAVRGIPADYDEWAARGNSEWSWANVLPYFRKLEDDADFEDEFHGKAGPLPIRRWRTEELDSLQTALYDVCRRLGFPDVRDHNHPDSTGVGPWPMNTSDGVRISAAVAYLHPARDRGNLTIEGNCLVDRVLLDGDRARGVEVQSGGVTRQIFGRRVVLSAGAIASPAILLRSGIGPRADLDALGIAPVVDLPGVGANLIDHVWAGVRAIPKPGVCVVPRPTVQIGGRYTAPSSSEFNDMQLYMASNADLRPFPQIAAQMGVDTIFTVYAVLQRPRSRGRLSLTSTDPRVQPHIDLNYLDDSEDLRRVADGLRLCWQVVHEPEIAGQTLRLSAPDSSVMATDEGIEAYVKQTCTTLFHPVGTAHMGDDDDPAAVVDQYCRVHGVRNLRVVDASIMPSIVRANTNLTCLMIGERAADLLQRDDSVAVGGSSLRTT